MKPFTTLTGKIAVLNRSNVDTDQIIPKQFLKRIEKTGYGRFAFFDWRYLPDGSENPEFELNQEKSRGASILLAGENFGCGSSREHAPWALSDYGFQVILAPSYADIFHQNCLKNGLLPISLEQSVLDDIRQKSNADGYELTINLEEQKITDNASLSESFTVDPYWKDMLLHGKDEIDLTFHYNDQITEFEERRATFL
ncbi:3-isopropylmalate dehydratase small subunit [Metabacillus litoralis]|jgi:3-isopropylmalate/(R)-2-methylmalate dehydratase small subunit|uniref:3-isopropylmalate dehydratase small subunit n=1 Tax=Metabacillus litoralis TaxID=152268 RepID=UPI00203F1365|nr:3-isopropylmalate dehydratase small subunit [Metabacillus litoralis]MCM3650656.1 3-isopropylmalate dehydratase small subunit [Metabacillus litoralis]